MIRRSKIAAWLLSLLLVLAEVGAFAHEIEHRLHATDAPCAQCLFVNHLDKVAPPAPVCLAAVTAESPEQSLPPVAPRPRHFTLYSVRAPPIPSGS